MLKHVEPAATAALPLPTRADSKELAMKHMVDFFAKSLGGRAFRSWRFELQHSYGSIMDLRVIMTIVIYMI